MATLLVIDDNQGVCSALTVLFNLHDITVLTANSPAAGLSILERQEVQLVIQDMNFTADTTSGKEGEALFAQIRALSPSLPVILLTAWTQLESAVVLVKQGAADYLAKPWDDSRLLSSAMNLLALQAAQEARSEIDNMLSHERSKLEQFDLCNIIYKSQPLLRLLQTATQVARADVPVLITGPSGAGKEKFAEIIHANSGLNGPLVKVNAGALPANLIESELFGVEAGAFTDAQQRQGRFEMADGGTLFLDEIANLSLEGQMKLLRVLQTGEFEPLGSAKTRHVAVRLVTATNSDLQQAISEGRFREDLYYRINLIELAVPSLNQRSDDILPLAEHFLAGKGVLSAQSKAALLEYHWPGNVRELENSIKRALLLSRQGEITPDCLGLQARNSLRNSLRNHEPSIEEIKQALLAYNNVVARAAKSLGLSRQALYRRIEKYGLK